MEHIAFTDKNDGYYNNEKSRFIQLIPEGPNKILDLGCAAGRLGRKLRELNKTSELVGVEIFEPAAMEAAKYYDRVYVADIEHINLDYMGYFDFVFCGDILEHLRDPWTMLNKIHIWLKKDAFLVSTIPNIRYWLILRDLIIFGKWEYTEAGVLDQTHLRFFTRNSFLKMLQKANYNVDYQEMVIHGQKKNFLNKLTFGIFEEFLGSQVLVMAKKTYCDLNMPSPFAEYGFIT